MFLLLRHASLRLPGRFGLLQRCRSEMELAAMGAVADLQLCDWLWLALALCGCSDKALSLHNK